MSIQNLSTTLVRAVTEAVLEKNAKDASLFANSAEVIVNYFHIEVGVQKELLTALVKDIEQKASLSDRPLVKDLPPKE